MKLENKYAKKNCYIWKCILVLLGFIAFCDGWEKENSHCLGEMPKRKLVCHWILFVENRIGARDSKRNCQNSIWSDWFWIHIKKRREERKKFVMNPYISMNLAILRYSMSAITSTPNIQSKQPHTHDFFMHRLASPSSKHIPRQCILFIYLNKSLFLLLLPSFELGTWVTYFHSTNFYSGKKCEFMSCTLFLSIFTYLFFNGCD